jgi:hypothetical protein
VSPLIYGQFVGGLTLEEGDYTELHSVQLPEWHWERVSANASEAWNDSGGWQQMRWGGILAGSGALPEIRQ